MMILVSFDPCMYVVSWTKLLLIIDVWCLIFTMICSMLISGHDDFFWKFEDEDLEEFCYDLHNFWIIHACEFCYDLHTVSCGFSCMFFMITCGLWHCMSLGFWTKRLRFICARLDFQILLRFESGLQHKFKLLYMIFLFPP